MMNPRLAYQFWWGDRIPTHKEWAKMERDGQTDFALGTFVRDCGDGECLWFSCGRGHAIPGRLESEDDQGFIWRRDLEGKTEFFIFRLLTLEKYKQFIKRHHIDDMPQDFHSERDLHQWFRRHFCLEPQEITSYLSNGYSDFVSVMKDDPGSVVTKYLSGLSSK